MFFGNTFLRGGASLKRVAIATIATLFTQINEVIRPSTRTGLACASNGKFSVEVELVERYVVAIF